MLFLAARSAYWGSRSVTCSTPSVLNSCYVWVSYFRLDAGVGEEIDDLNGGLASDYLDPIVGGSPLLRRGIYLFPAKHTVLFK